MMTKNRPDDFSREAEAAIRAVAAKHGWVLDKDDPAIAMCTAMCAMLEERGYLRKGEEKVVPMHRPARQELPGAQAAPPSTRLPYPKEHVHYSRDGKIHSVGNEPSIFETREWRWLMRAGRGTLRILFIGAIGAFIGIELFARFGGA